jgi:hypothetical protein
MAGDTVGGGGPAPAAGQGTKFGFVKEAASKLAKKMSADDLEELADDVV